MTTPQEINTALLAGFRRENADPDLKRTHHFDGRFENIYIDRAKIPEVEPVISFALSAAQRLLAGRPRRFGFWFNAMEPGHRTSLHSHEELDERLSAVYYVTAPADAGRLVLHDNDRPIAVTPRAGLLVLFAPDLPHEVETNNSTQMRLSVAFNFGPVPPET